MEYFKQLAANLPTTFFFLNGNVPFISKLRLKASFTYLLTHSYLLTRSSESYFFSILPGGTCRVESDSLKPRVFLITDEDEDEDVQLSKKDKKVTLSDITIYVHCLSWSLPFRNVTHRISNANYSTEERRQYDP